MLLSLEIVEMNDFTRYHQLLLCFILRMSVILVEGLFVVVSGDKEGDENKSTKTIMGDLQILVCYKVSINLINKYRY